MSSTPCWIPIPHVVLQPLRFSSLSGFVRLNFARPAKKASKWKNKVTTKCYTTECSACSGGISCTGAFSLSTPSPDAAPIA